MKLDPLVEEYRVRTGSFASEPGSRFGAFQLPLSEADPRKGRRYLWVIVDDGRDPGMQTHWEHVSVSTNTRCPSWEEMCRVKDLFWAPDECVVQFHPPKAEYVNRHPYCLHLWRRVGENLETPPRMLVG